jgi:hypothetical protein
MWNYCFCDVAHAIISSDELHFFHHVDSSSSSSALQPRMGFSLLNNLLPS